MRVLYCITKSEMGGAQTHVWLLMQGMIRKDVEIHVMSYPGGWLEEKCRELHVSFQPNPYFKNSYNPLNLVRALIRVRRVAKAVKPDIIHCHSGGGGFYGRLGTIGMPLNRVFTAHGWSFRKGVPIFQRVVAWIAEWKMSFLTHYTICVSKYDFGVGVQSGVVSRRSSSVIYNGTPIPTEIAKLGEHTKFTVIFAGRFAPPKRQDIVIAAFALLPGTIRDRGQLICAGSGPHNDMLRSLADERRISKQVRLESYATEEMGRVYQHADLFVLISDYEAFPMTLIEAMSYGLPVVVNNVGGLHEVVDGSVGALLPRRITPQKVSEVLMDLLSDATQLSVFGKNSRERIEEHFSVQTMQEKTYHVYQRVLR